MLENINFDLPNQDNWKFDRFYKSYKSRADYLENVDAPTLLKNTILKALDASDIRIGVEKDKNHPNNCRIVIQFAIPLELFDWFFNGRTGYRAHFRCNAYCGLIFNAELIQAIEFYLKKNLADSFLGYEFEFGMKNIRQREISKLFLLSSLHPYFSKIWYCYKRMEPDPDKVKLKVANEKPYIIVGNSNWRSFYPKDQNSSWLDIKGGFIDDITGHLYQPKDPLLERGKALHEEGFT